LYLGLDRYFLKPIWGLADGATPQPLIELVELSLLSTAKSGFGKRGARNAKQTGNRGIESKIRASDAVVVQDIHIRRGSIVTVGEFEQTSWGPWGLNANPIAQ
jgi:hypothetical protein